LTIGPGKQATSGASSHRSSWRAISIIFPFSKHGLAYHTSADIA